MKKIQFSEADDLIDIRYDNVFKAVFTKNTAASRGALSRLISALINRKVTVTTINANEPPINDIRDRPIRFDICCKTGKGKLINIEMGFNPNSFEPVRLEFHAGKLFIGQDIHGINKSYNDLKETYQIAILAKMKFFPDETFLHTFEYYDAEHKMSLNGRSRIITIELTKLNKIIKKPAKIMSVQEYWAVYFRYLTDKGKRRKINEIIEREEGIAMASKVLLTISRDEVERARLNSELKYELDTQSKITDAKREGIKIGAKNSQKSTARNALLKGLSVETVQEITGLDIETVKKLAAGG